MLTSNVKGRIELARKLMKDRKGSAMDCDTEEWIVYKNCVSLAHAQDELSVDDATVMHSILGRSAEHFNGHDLATKYVICGLMVKLINWKLTLGAKCVAS